MAGWMWISNVQYSTVNMAGHFLHSFRQGADVPLFGWDLNEVIFVTLWSWLFSPGTTRCSYWSPCSVVCIYPDLCGRRPTQGQGEDTPAWTVIRLHTDQPLIRTIGWICQSIEPKILTFRSVIRPSSSESEDSEVKILAFSRMSTNRGNTGRAAGELRTGGDGCFKGKGSFSPGSKVILYSLIKKNNGDCTCLLLNTC